MKRSRLIAALVAAAAAAAAAPGAAPASVQVGSSGWQWGNPLPQGNQISKLSFAGPQGYAVGAFGTLLSSPDGGSTWTGLRSGTFSNLTEIQAISPTSIFAGGGCVGRRSDDGGQTFRRVAFTPVESACNESLAAAWWLNGNTGYLALTDGTVFRTDDGGATFTPKNPVPGTENAGGRGIPTDLVFLNENVGMASSTDGKIYRTTDAGNAWTQVSSTDRAARAIVIPPVSSPYTLGDNLYAVGDKSLFLKSSDGGATWKAEGLGIPDRNLTSIACASLLLCTMTTDQGRDIVRTTDGGATPSKLVTPSQDQIFATAFASATRVVVAGAMGSTAVSDDGGEKFTPIGGRLTGSYTRMRAGGEAGTAFAPGDNGSLAKTIDGGKTWTRGNVSTSEDVIDVAFPTRTVGFALDEDGGLFRTDNGGASWRTLDTGSTADPFEVVATSAEDVLLAGPRGMRRSTDGGETFETVAGRDVVRSPIDTIDRAGAALFAYDARGKTLLRSTDGGENWRPVVGPGKPRRVGGRLFNNLRIEDVDFQTPNAGFFLADDGRLFSTRNAGRRWTELPGVGANDAYGVAFSSARNGYLQIPDFGDSSDAGFLLRTTDGGKTFRPQFVVSASLPAYGVVGSQGTDYLLGGTSSLLFSTTGGDSGAESTLSITTRRKTLPRRGRITVTGKLNPATANESVTVSWRRPGSTSWQSQTVRTASNGQFTSSWTPRRGKNVFVAQWSGNFRNSGDGTEPLTVTVRR